MDGLKGLNADDMRAVGQQARQGVLMGRITCNKPHEKIAAAADHVTFPRFGPGAHLCLEGFEHATLLAFKTYQGVKVQGPAQQGRINLSVVALDNSQFLKPPHASQAGRRGNTGATGQFHIGHASISLEFGDDLPVDGIQFNLCGVRRCVHFTLMYMAGDMIRKDGTCVGSLYMGDPDTH